MGKSILNPLLSKLQDESLLLRLRTDNSLSIMANTYGPLLLEHYRHDYPLQSPGKILQKAPHEDENHVMSIVLQVQDGDVVVLKMPHDRYGYDFRYLRH